MVSDSGLGSYNATEILFWLGHSTIMYHNQIGALFSPPKHTHCCYQATQKLTGNREDQQLHGFQQNEDGRLGRIANTLNIFTNISNSECQPHNEYLSIS